MTQHPDPTQATTLTTATLPEVATRSRVEAELCLRNDDLAASLHDACRGKERLTVERDSLQREVAAQSKAILAQHDTIAKQAKVYSERMDTIHQQKEMIADQKKSLLEGVATIMGLRDDLAKRDASLASLRAVLARAEGEKWISVDVSLPNDYRQFCGPFFVWPQGDSPIAYYSPSRGRWEDGTTRGLDHDVTHWMSLPRLLGPDAPPRVAPEGPTGERERRLVETSQTLEARLVQAMVFFNGGPDYEALRSWRHALAAYDPSPAETKP